MIRVLIVEDEKNLSRFIEMELKHEGMEVALAYDGITGLRTALDRDWDVILLDIMLPGMDGLEVCRRIRLAKSTPIIMLTARDGVSDRVNGLDSGADDYMPKPFAIEELHARIRAVVRRKRHLTSSILGFKDIRVNLEAQTVTQNQVTVDLTKREYDLLVCFMQNINRVMTRDALLSQVWGYDSEVETNVVDVYVRYLRNKLIHGQNDYIQTVRGSGYVLR